MTKTRWVVNTRVKIWTESFGKEKNPAVLLIVGAGAISVFYSDDFCQKIAENGFFVIRYDQRDYGKSTHFAQINPEDLANLKKLQDKLPYRIEALVEDANSILDAYEIQKVHMVGHSMGGIIAQLFAVMHPHRLLSFTSISVAPASQRYQLEPIPQETMKRLLLNNPVGNFDVDINGWLESLRLLNGRVEFDQSLALAYVKEIYKRDLHPGVAWNHIGIQRFIPDYFNRFQNNLIPGLILHGSADPLQPSSYASLTHQMIKNTDLVILPDVGHMFFNVGVENQIVECLLKFFRTVANQ